ncbi:hypothetical protein JRO89_XS04G0011300 [Xanthoceras sorbifolium]|uniref:Uncharacterized protein n=1 Tax=Xanthoceras sorbifolium TaxID=99658 RepID=A0ABQ8I406_9ROSI|nr:hypothetical protein JRO89_XS04G0011300 [Xanthoceras sorbifolium]
MNNSHDPQPQPQPPAPTPIPTPSPSPTPSAVSVGDCGNCGAHLRGLLHNVRLRGIQRRLCTSCVLRLHPSAFCPLCFAYYDSNPPHPSKRFACSKCASFTHSHCVPSPPPPPPYLCPPCSCPSPASFTFFRNDAAADGCSVGGGRRVDGKSAAVLLCAARIASASMTKAVAVARIEAEKKAKDAASARKRAREALERVALLITKNNSNAARTNGGGGDGSAASFFNVNKKQNVNVSQELVNNVKAETG